MTSATSGQTMTGMLSPVFAPARRLRAQLSHRVHLAGDAFARERGWAITRTTGRLGFGARIYRDPRFGQCSAGTRSAKPVIRGTARLRGTSGD